MKKTFKIAALALLASFALALAGCSNSSGGGAALAALGGGTQTGSGGGNGSGGDNGGDGQNGGQSQQNTTETKWTISGTEYTVKDGKVTVTQNGTKTEVGTVDSSGVVTITQGGQTITVQAQGAGSSNVTVTIATTTADSNGASTTTTKTYSGDITSGTLANTQDASDTITIAKVETTTGGGNGGNATTYTITIAQGIEHGTIGADRTSAAQGDTVTLTATPQDGYRFGEWSVTDSDGAAVTVEGGAFEMPAKNVTVSATFTQLAANNFSISVIGGTATFADQPVTSVSAGATITITANAPEAGKVFDRWTTTTEGVTFNNETNSTTTFVMSAKNVSITATYKWIDYAVTYVDGVDSAVIAVPTDSTAYHMDDTVTVMFDGVGTRDGYTFAGWSDGTTTYTSAGSKTFSMGTANVTLTALWNTAITQYTFHDTPEFLPAGTDGSNGTGSTYVYFGDYPQDVLSKTLEAQLTFDTSHAITRGGLTYIPASDGNYYVHICAQTPYSGSRRPKYVDGTYTENDSWRYFKVMPVKWRVLTNTYDVDGTSGSKTGRLLVAESIIDANVNFCDDTIWRDPHKDSPSDYKASGIRAYLNGLPFYRGKDSKYRTIFEEQYVSKGFLQTAFTQDSISRIIRTHVDNSAAQKLDPVNGNGGRGTCDDTDDKLFLLSSHEWTNSAYGFGVASDRTDGLSTLHNRQRYPTDFARARNASVGYKYAGWASDYYTRSPASTDNGKTIGYYYVDRVIYDGQVVTGEEAPSAPYTTSAKAPWSGIVPALCIGLNGEVQPADYVFAGTTWQCDLGSGFLLKIQFSSTGNICTNSMIYNGNVASSYNGAYSTNGKTVFFQFNETDRYECVVNDSVSSHSFSLKDGNDIERVFVKQ